MGNGGIVTPAATYLQDDICGYPTQLIYWLVIVKLYINLLNFNWSEWTSKLTTFFSCWVQWPTATELRSSFGFVRFSVGLIRWDESIRFNCHDTCTWVIISIKFFKKIYLGRGLTRWDKELIGRFDWWSSSTSFSIIFTSLSARFEKRKKERKNEMEKQQQTLTRTYLNHLYWINVISKPA